MAEDSPAVRGTAVPCGGWRSGERQWRRLEAVVQLRWRCGVESAVPIAERGGLRVRGAAVRACVFFFPLMIKAQHTSLSKSEALNQV